MNSGYSAPGPTARTSQNDGRPMQALRPSLPGGPPPITDPSGKAAAQAGMSQPRPGGSPQSPSNAASAPFPELGRAGSLFGWFLDFVSPRPEAGNMQSFGSSPIGNFPLIVEGTQP
jgi:hypothetical protein